MIPINLNPEDYDFGQRLGKARQDRAFQRNYKAKHGGPGADAEGLVKAQLGAVGEVAAARWLGLQPAWTLDTFKQPDLWIPIQVRSRPNFSNMPKGDHLIVYPEDSPEHIYVLVYARGPECQIVGWIRGADAQQAKYLFGYNGREPAYFVPPADLHEPSGLFSAVGAVAHG